MRPHVLRISSAVNVVNEATLLVNVLRSLKYLWQRMESTALYARYRVIARKTVPLYGLPSFPIRRKKTCHVKSMPCATSVAQTIIGAMTVRWIDVNHGLHPALSRQHMPVSLDGNLQMGTLHHLLTEVETPSEKRRLMTMTTTSSSYANK